MALQHTRMLSYSTDSVPATAIRLKIINELSSKILILNTSAVPSWTRGMEAGWHGKALGAYGWKCSNKVT